MYLCKPDYCAKLKKKKLTKKLTDRRAIKIKAWDNFHVRK